MLIRGIMLGVNDVFYNFKSNCRTDRCFPMASLHSDAGEIKISISFKDTNSRMLLAATHEKVWADTYNYEGVASSENAGKLGHPENTHCNIYIDQNLEDISKNGISKEKVNILKTPDAEHQLMLLLNALDALFCHMLGQKYVYTTIRAA